MTTFNDWVEKVFRRVYSGSVDSTVQLAAAIGTTDTTFTIVPAVANALRPGAILSVDLEIMYITAVSGTGNISVVRGYNGSTAATHTINTLCYIQPIYTKFDIGVALNDELARLSSPDNGLFRVGMQTITYNPVYMGYDLQQAINDNFIDIMEVRHKIPFPTRNYPKIAKWKVLRSIGDTAVFPSGAGIVFYEGGYPGQPVYVQYSSAFKTVDLTIPSNYSSDVATLTGMTSTMLDIPPLGAEIQLTLPREIRRNFMSVQPDPRKAPEIPAQSISNSVQALMMTYNLRITEEAGRLARQYTRTEGW
jgi:hypothetical protein